jgi:hypothetical protein
MAETLPTPRRRWFRFSLRALLAVMTVSAVYLGIGLRFGTGVLVFSLLCLVLLMQLWYATRPGPKAAGVVSLLAIVSLKTLFWFSDDSRDAPDPPLVVVFVVFALVLALQVIWLYSAVRAILTRAFPNVALGLLSMIWICDPHIRLMLDSLQDLIGSHWAPAIKLARPFRGALDALWGRWNL